VLALTARLYLRLLVATLVLAGVSLFIGGRLPPAVETSVITRDRCFVPCTFGIVPGTTDRREAEGLMERATNGDYLVSPDSRISFIVQDDKGRSIAGLIHFSFMERTRVGSISLFVQDANADLGQLGDLLLAGYQPRRAYRTCEGTPPRMLLTFGIEDRMVVEIPLDEGLTPHTPLTVLDIYAPNISSIESTLAGFGCSVETGWHGFAPLWKYFAIRPSP
jgi:hypothetical protein